MPSCRQIGVSLKRPVSHANWATTLGSIPPLPPERAASSPAANSSREPQARIAASDADMSEPLASAACQASTQAVDGVASAVEGAGRTVGVQAASSASPAARRAARTERMPITPTLDRRVMTLVGSATTVKCRTPCG